MWLTNSMLAAGSTPGKAPSLSGTGIKYNADSIIAGWLNSNTNAKLQNSPHIPFLNLVKLLRCTWLGCKLLNFQNIFLSLHIIIHFI